MQMLDVKWSKDALEDLDIIWEYIADDSVDNADSFVEQIIGEAEKICKVPKSGTVIPELGNDNFREYFYKGYTIVYEIADSYILIHEVFNQKRIHIRTYIR